VMINAGKEIGEWTNPAEVNAPEAKIGWIGKGPTDTNIEYIRGVLLSLDKSGGK